MANSPEYEAFAQNFQRAVDGGLTAAAYVYRNAIVQKLMKGYTSGHFVTPHVALTVTLTPAFDSAQGRVILVGTNVMYALYWEMGHYNIFTRKFERVEHWRETMLETGPAQFDAFTRVFGRLWAE